MNLGKTLFAQLMEFVPWTSFARIVARYSGDARVSTLPSTEHFRIMAYAQLTWRESLRDIEVTLGANTTKLYAMGLRQAVRRSTLGDVNVLDILPMQAGAFYIMDRGYLDFARLYTMHQAGAFFVTRCPSPISMPDACTRPARTKRLAWCAIKQHLRIKKFLGTSENAVKSQVWCAIATYVLIAIVKKELQLDASLYTCLQILSVSVFEKTQISCALQPDDHQNQPAPTANQLILDRRLDRRWTRLSG